MKKIYLIVLVVLLAGFGYFIFNRSNQKVSDDQEISQEEQEFNESGQAKAILDETDLWKYYESEDGGFSIKYPHDVSLNEDSENLFNLTIKVTEIDGLEGTLGFNEETALENIGYLQKGEYGENVDIPLNESKKVIKIGNTYAQEFMVLSRFEVCSVLFERKVYFFNNNKQIVITLSGPKEMIIEEMSDYFVKNSDNCGDEDIWDFDKQADFYNTLSEGNGAGTVQDWFDSFDKIVGTIEINDSLLESFQSLQGTWTSVDDGKSVVEFSGNKVIDYYDGEKMNEGTFEINSDLNYVRLILLFDGEEYEYSILNLSEDSLILSYLARGETLEYTK